MSKKAIIAGAVIAVSFIAVLAFQGDSPGAEDNVPQQQQAQNASPDDDVLLDQEHPVRKEILDAIDPYVVAEECEKHPGDEICGKKQ